METPSVTFIKGKTSYNTFEDWKLAVQGTPRIALPKQKVQTVDIPGRNGILDLSNSMRIGGGPLFQNREGSFSFVFLDMSFYNTTDWSVYINRKRTIINEIVKIVHGQFLDIVTTAEPGNTYRGRFSVDDIGTGDSNSPDTLTISYSIQPDPISIIA